MVPAGSDPTIVWPKGTRTIQCHKSPSKHWNIKVSCWDRLQRYQQAGFANTNFHEQKWAPNIKGDFRKWCPQNLHRMDYIMMQYFGELDVLHRLLEDKYGSPTRPNRIYAMNDGCNACGKPDHVSSTCPEKVKPRWRELDSTSQIRPTRNPNATPSVVKSEPY